MTAAHKIWEEQCAATERIRERFGLQNALDYLLGEKPVAFAKESERHPEFAPELSAFMAQIRRQFTAEEIREYLDYPERSNRSERRAIFSRLRQLFQWRRRKLQSSPKRGDRLARETTSGRLTAPGA
jgi:hypothetical protein